MLTFRPSAMWSMSGVMSSSGESARYRMTTISRAGGRVGVDVSWSWRWNSCWYWFGGSASPLKGHQPMEGRGYSRRINNSTLRRSRPATTTRTDRIAEQNSRGGSVLTCHKHVCGLFGCPAWRYGINWCPPRGRTGYSAPRGSRRRRHQHGGEDVEGTPPWPYPRCWSSCWLFWSLS